jgi:hypothetical protein
MGVFIVWSLVAIGLIWDFEFRISDLVKWFGGGFGTGGTGTHCDAFPPHFCQADLNYPAAST